VNHVAIDLGGRESQICIRSSDGAVVAEKKVRTAKLGELLSKMEPSRVLVETCSEAFWVADQARQHGHEPRVVPATVVRALGVGQRGLKTDVRDARLLSEVSTRVLLPSVHVPSRTARERKSLCAMREGLVGARTQLINTVRGWLRQELLRVKSGATETFSRRVRASAEAAGRSLPGYVERQLATIEQLNEQIAEADRDIAAQAKEDPVCRRLMTVPGVGPLTSLLFSATLDGTERFESTAALCSYLGLTPGEDSSSDRVRRTSITKAGSRRLRRVLVQASWCAKRTRPNDAMVRWALEVEKRRGKRVAAVALARKIGGILYAMWRDGTDYVPMRGANQAALDALDEARGQELARAVKKKRQ
jgi:transposase